MNMNKIYVSVLMAAVVALGAGAQEKLNKEITLDKDFVPVEKKAVKKSALPKVVIPAKSTDKAQVNYSNWAEPTAVGTTIPTMLPYGYRTAHIFSGQRGYLELGAGSQLNFDGSAGYRIVDTEHSKLGLWLQHNSTWSGKNSTKLIADDDLRLKQKFNDNTVGLDFSQHFAPGDLVLGAKMHYDNFNYYGGLGSWWDDNKQSLVSLALRGGWNGKASIAGRDFDYRAGLSYDYSAYDKGLHALTGGVDYDGARDHNVKANLGVSYATSAFSTLGIDARLDYVNRSYKAHAASVSNKYTDDMTVVTLSPFYGYRGENLCARLGGNVDFSLSDGAAIRISPNASVSYDVAPGATLYGLAGGGKRINTLARMAAINRYSDPMGRYSNTFVPVDAEFGLKIGPFAGFKAKIYGGYGMARNEMLAFTPALYYTPFASDSHIAIDSANRYAPVYYKAFDTQGFKMGGALEYRYRSVAVLNLDVVYAPQDNNISPDKTYDGYTLGLDRASTVAHASVKLYPVKPLEFDLGLEYRGGRHAVLETVTDYSLVDGVPNYALAYSLAKMDDVINLHVGARYRFDKMLTLWLQGANLLNKKWDVTLGQGAQRLSVMGGIALVF